MTRDVRTMSMMELINCLCTAEMVLGAVIAHDPNCVSAESADYVAANAEATRYRVELSRRVDALKELV